MSRISKIDNLENTKMNTLNSLSDLLEALNKFCEKITCLDFESCVEIRKFLVSLLNPLRIWVVTESPGYVMNRDGVYMRIVLYSISNANQDNNLVKIANGLVLQVSNAKPNILTEVKVIPANNLNTQYSIIDIEQHLKNNEYSIFPVFDGTIVNAYFCDFKNEWIFTTRKSFDIGNLSWRGETYKTVLNDVLSTEAFDKKHCYTISFKHPAFHPFNQKKEWSHDFSDSHEYIKTARLVSGFDLETREKLDINLLDIGIPAQKEIEFTTNEKYVYNYFKTQCDNALRNYIETGEINYGYVLRGNFNNQYSDILMKSSLYREINKFIYQIPRTEKHLLNQEKRNFQNFNYIIVKCWLNAPKRNLFFTLFPELKHYSIILNNFTVISSELIFRKFLSAGKIAFNASLHEFKDYTELLEPAQNFADKLYSVLAYNFSPFKNKKKELHDKDWCLAVIQELITNPDYVSIYLNCLNF